MADERVLWRHYPPWLLFKAFCGLVRLLPEALACGIFSSASYLAYLADAKHRRVALGNLDLAFGDSKTGREKRAIARDSFRSLFLTAAEFIRLPLMVCDIESRVEIVTGHEPIRRALSEKRGVIFIISHFGNWEILAHRGLSVCDRKIASVARPIANPLIYREIERLRGVNGAVVLEKKWVAKELVEKIRDNWCVAILMDQYSGRSAPFVPFFGRPVSTTPAVALLAMKTGAAVIPIFNVRQRFGRHHLNVCPEVEMARTGDKEADIMENCARCNRVIEEWVRRYPDHWLWMHRRWRRKKAAGEP